MNTTEKIARFAGFAYLTNILTGVFAQYVRSTLIVPGDAAATADNIMASQLLFRLGFMSDLIMVAAYLMMGLFFYMLLRPVNQNVALLMLMLNLAGVPMLGINTLNEFAPLLLLNGASYLQAFPAAQLQALVMFFLDLQDYGYLIAAISYGAYLLPLGYLVFKSGYLPRLLGVLLMIASFGQMIPLFQMSLLPGYDVITYPGLGVAVLAEFSFCLWLLIKGAKMPAAKLESAYAV